MIKKKIIAFFFFLLAICTLSCIPEVPTSNSLDPLNEEFALTEPFDLSVHLSIHPSSKMEFSFSWKLPSDAVYSGFLIEHSETGRQDSYNLYRKVDLDSLTIEQYADFKLFLFTGEVPTASLTHYYRISTYYEESFLVTSEPVQTVIALNILSFTYTLSTSPSEFLFSYNYNLPFETQIHVEGRTFDGDFRHLYTQTLTPTFPFTTHSYSYQVNSFTENVFLRFKLTSESFEGEYQYPEDLSSESCIVPHYQTNNPTFRPNSYFVEYLTEGGFVLGFTISRKCDVEKYILYRKNSPGEEYHELQRISSDRRHFVLPPGSQYENDLYLITAVEDGEETEFYRPVYTFIIADSVSLSE